MIGIGDAIVVGAGFMVIAALGVILAVGLVLADFIAAYRERTEAWKDKPSTFWGPRHGEHSPFSIEGGGGGGGYSEGVNETTEDKP